MVVPAPRFRFGPFELLPRTRELLKEGRRIKVRPQPFQVLEVLLERGGDVVTREDLRERVWQADTFVDFEHGLNTAIKELRAVLNDSATEPRYIETMPKVGYRMIADVEAPEAEGSFKNVIELEEPAAPIRDFVWSGKSGWAGIERKKEEEKPKSSSWRWIAGAVAAILVVGGIWLGVRWMRARGVSRSEAVKLAGAKNGKVMLAVLPFQNLTGDAGQEYFSDGLTEEMIAQLGLMDPEHFGVIARTSVMHYKSTQENAEQIGRELGVQYVLEGSVRRDAERVRITAQLIRAADQTRLWTKEFDREVQSLLAVQSEIALETVDEIQHTLGAKKPGAALAAVMSRDEYEAYDQYLKGLYFLNKRTLTGFEQATGHFREAIRKNPQSAPAYAELANTYTLLSGYSLSPASKYMPQARAAALRALELNDKLPEAHTALALIVQNYDWDWKTAEKEFKRAIELNPNYATAHHWYAEHLGFRGRFEEAFKESDEAKRLDPLSLIIAADRGVLLYFARDYDRAIEQLRAVQEMDPAFPRGHMIQNAYAAKGMYQEAMADIENCKREYGVGAWYWSAKARVYGQWGHRAQARRALQELEGMNKRHPVDPGPLAWAHLGMGHREEALQWLEKAYEQHSNAMTTLKVEPVYDSARSDQRFQVLLRRVGLGD
jgi:TolB-like protein/DNA-binding winged helix-turn-helix (wHTH) protein/Tfp pilus assembly protein PilF